MVVMAVILAALSASASAANDSIPGKRSSTLWIKQLFQNGFHIHDPNIAYPRFPRFALKVYDWGNDTFNTYDTTYVVGTGCNWKFQLKSYNWMESSALLKDEKSLSMHSLPYCDAGFSLSFMAVSIGYMWDINKLFRDFNSRKTFNFDFTTSRFNLTFMTVHSNGNMVIDRFGNYNKGHRVRIKFNDVEMSNRHLGLLYFLNHNHYSHASAYTYSKYQLQTAGTWLLGLSYNEENVSMDFSGLPPVILEYNPLEVTDYSSHFKDYGFMGGYSRNIVLSLRKWVFNYTVTLSLGYRRSVNTDDKGRDGIRSRIANRGRLDAALVYNHRAFFAALTFKSWALTDYNAKTLNFNAFGSLAFNVGMRF